MTILVIAEHDNKVVAPATLNTVAAAAKIGGDIHVLVAGQNVGAVAEAAAKIAGVSKVLVADNAAYAHLYNGNSNNHNNNNNNRNRQHGNGNGNGNGRN